METHDNCPFCHLKERVLLENEHANLFLSNPRKMEGHLLVTPKRHIEIPWQSTDDELVSMFGLIRIAQETLVEKYGGGVDIRQHYRPFMKQGRIKVDHLHFHVYPRTEYDKFYQRVEKYETDVFEDLTDEEQKRIETLFE